MILGLYYLQSRYYDPIVKRFISADGVMSGTNGSLHGFNLFAYCFNNPVMMTDTSGDWPELFKGVVKCIAKYVVKPMVEKAQEILSNVDFTYSRGINVSGSPSAFAFNAQGGVSVDSKGNVAIQGSLGGGVTTGTPGASITEYRSVTNAPTIKKLEGAGYQIGGSVGFPAYCVPVVVGGDVNIIPDDALGKTYWGITSNAGIGTPGMEIHSGMSYTGTLPGSQFNIFELAEQIYIKIMEW